MYDDNEGGSTQCSEPEQNFKHEDFGRGGLGLDADIRKVISDVINGNPIQEDSTNVSEQTQIRDVTENLQVDIVDEIDEEVIELEFERAVEKMHSHEDYKMYCPNCSNRITKVVLRRRKIAKKIPPSSNIQPPKNRTDLFGCLSCFSIFINAGNKLNPFRIFGKGKEPERSPVQVQQQQALIGSTGNVSQQSSPVQQQQQQALNWPTGSVPQQQASNGTTGNVPQQQALNGPTGNVPRQQALNGPTGNVPQQQALNGPTRNVPQQQALNGITGNVPQQQALNGTTGNVPQQQALNGTTGNVPQQQALNGTTGNVPQQQALNGTTGNVPQQQASNGPTGNVPKQALNGPTGDVPQQSSQVQQQQQEAWNGPTSTSSSTISNVPQQQHTSVVTSSITTSSTHIKGKAFDLFSIFGKRREGNDLYAQPSPISGSTVNKVAAAAAVAAVAIAGNRYDKSSLQGSGLNGRFNIDNKGNLDDVINEEKLHVMPDSEIKEELNITPQQHQVQGNSVSVALDNSSEYNANDTIQHGQELLGSTANKVSDAATISRNNFQGSELDRDVIIDINKNQEDFVSVVKHPVSVGSEIKEEVDISAIHQQGGDVQVVIGEESVERETSRIITTSTTVITTVPGIVTEEVQSSSRSLEILKAIVYGGLMESIASLSIVSSAAASGTSTMKILALGLAYLVSGLVVIGHNLRDLRHDELSESNEAENRYKELLGRRQNFTVHSLVVVLSYLIFGIIPPLTYAFTFRESDDRDMKLVAVAGTSLLCIMILAISKAYTRGQHTSSVYFKAVFYYVFCALMVGGIGFAVGDLGKKLMEKLGWWDSSPLVHAIWIPKTESINLGLASY